MPRNRADKRLRRGKLAARRGRNAANASPMPAAEIILTGEADISWPCGIPFDDPGCTAVSAGGRDISKRIRRAGEVNCMTPGEYTLTYSLRIDGNELELQRRGRRQRDKELLPKI